MPLYGPDGRVIEKRTPEQIEFDRRFRQQLSDNGGQFFSRQFIESLRRNIERRDSEKAVVAALQDGRDGCLKPFTED